MIQAILAGAAPALMEAVWMLKERMAKSNRSSSRHPEIRRRVLGRSQTELLHRHLAAGRSISPAEALTVFGITRLAARVYDLEKRGKAITRVDRVDAKGQRYTRYFYA